MLGPDRAHLLVRCEFAALRRSPGASDRIAFLRRKSDRRWQIIPSKLHDHTRDVVLLIRRQTAYGLDCIVEELCHAWKILVREIEVQADANAQLIHC